MKNAWLLVVALTLLVSPLFAARNVVHDAWKLDRKLRKDSNVIKVVDSYVDRGDGSSYDVFIVYVHNCYDHGSKRIPTWYKNVQVVVHCEQPNNDHVKIYPKEEPKSIDPIPR